MDNSNLVNAEVIYKNVDDDQVVTSKKISGPADHPVNPINYKKYIPNNYQFKNFGRFNQNLKNGDVDVIYVKKTSDQSNKGSIMVDYINANNQLIGHNKFTSQVGSRFDVNQCRATIPTNYKLDRILTGKKINVFKANSQIILAQVSKVHYIKVSIKYLSGDRVVGRANAKGVLGAPFSIDRYIQNVPKGYKLIKVASQFSKVFKQDREIDIKVAKKMPKPSPRLSKSTSSSNSVAQKNPKEIGAILMKLASSLHDLGMTISKSKKL